MLIPGHTYLAVGGAGLLECLGVTMNGESQTRCGANEMGPTGHGIPVDTSHRIVLSVMTRGIAFREREECGEDCNWVSCGSSGCALAMAGKSITGCVFKKSSSPDPGQCIRYSIVCSPDMSHICGELGYIIHVASLPW